MKPSARTLDSKMIFDKGLRVNAIVQESTTKGLMFYMGEEEQYGKMTVSFFQSMGKAPLPRECFTTQPRLNVIHND